LFLLQIRKIPIEDPSISQLKKSGMLLGDIIEYYEYVDITEQRLKDDAGSNICLLFSAQEHSERSLDFYGL